MSCWFDNHSESYEFTDDEASYGQTNKKSEAWAILLALATTHDVYTYVKRGRNEYPPFSNYLRKFLSFLNAKVCLTFFPMTMSL